MYVCMFTSGLTRRSLTARPLFAETPISISLYAEGSKTKPSILRYLPLQQAPFSPRRLMSCPWTLWLFQVVCFRSLHVYHRRSKHKHKIIFFSCFALWLDTRYRALIVTIRFCPNDFWVWGGVLSLCCRVFKVCELNPHVWPFKKKTTEHYFSGFWGAVYYAVQRDSNFWVCEWNPKVYLFKWNWAA